MCLTLHRNCLIGIKVVREQVCSRAFGEGLVKIHILVAFKDEYRSFRDAIAVTFRTLRPGDEVEAAALGALGERVARFDPHLVIASLPNAVDPWGRGAVGGALPGPGPAV